MNKKIKIGTRKSLLAWAQSGQVAREIERLNPGVSVELVGIETRGDRIQDVSLREVNGKEFFVAELDEALGSGQVDLCVHSMKDLSLDRPAAFTLAAIPRRANPRDVVLFGPGVERKIAVGKTLKIGTSSPRRLENIPAFLRRALPRLESPDLEAKVELVEIRGNVNTRLSRVHEPEGSDRALDGVVLAFAGLIRLWADTPGRAELTRLLEGVRWMVLPLRECPAAPAQGALAIECRANDAETRAILGKLHDPETEKFVARERKLLADWGGGCHQAFGATCVSPNPAVGPLLFIRGRMPDGKRVDELQWAAPPEKPDVLIWDGPKWRPSGALENEADAEAIEKIPPKGGVFIAHARAVPAGRAESMAALSGARIWVSGTASWERLAKKGLWVEGCAEGLGFEFLRATIEEPVLRLAAYPRDWTILTHEAAVGDWAESRVLATYRLEACYPEAAIHALHSAREIFWGSGSQFDELKSGVRADARHACGPGKTAKKLRNEGISPFIFPSVEEWRKWTKQS
ncbi:MAG: hydroxymethylbilane synthase [Oligoflexia bacterium]|nr:hydroxymethylbilane synthase [Oligoflexia bacterium]